MRLTQYVVALRAAAHVLGALVLCLPIWLLLNGGSALGTVHDRAGDFFLLPLIVFLWSFTAAGDGWRAANARREAAQGRRD